MRAQASMEMLLLAAGAVLLAVLVGYYVVSSVVSVYSEIEAFTDSQVQDSEPPVVTLTGVLEGWQNSPAEVGVSCFDSGSGCDARSYRVYVSTNRINQCPENYNDYSQQSPVIISSHAWVCGAAKDNAGNVGFSDVYEVRVDTTLPVTSTDDLIGISPHIVDLSCTDSESGCVATYYYFVYGITSCSSDEGMYREGDTVVLLCGVGRCTYTVCAYSVDSAGNKEGPKSFTVEVIGSSSLPPPRGPGEPILPQ